MAVDMWLWWWWSGGGDGEADGISVIWTSGYWRREEGMEEERLEGMRRVVLKSLEAMCLQSSMVGKRWPWPKNGRTHISLDIFDCSLVGLFGLLMRIF